MAPMAVSLTEDTKRYDLKSCPGGFVELRRLTYAEFLQRREVTSKLHVNMGGNKNKQNGQAGLEGELSMLAAEVVYFEFKNCIVDHNLEDANGTQLNFKYRQHVDMLDPRIGDEIGLYINEMNQFQPENLGEESKLASLPSTENPKKK